MGTSKEFSIALEIGCAPLQERLQSFLEIIRSKQEKQLRQDVMGMRLEVFTQAVAEEPLHGSDPKGCVRRYLLCPAHRLRHQVIVRNDLVHQPQFERTLGRDVVTDEANLARPRPSNQPWQIPGTATLRHDAALGECRCKFRAIAHQAQVATECQIEPVAGCRTVDGTDNRSVDAMD